MENKQIKIVAIDDNESNIIVLQALLEESFSGFDFQYAYSGQAGLDLCLAVLPDVILLDVVMPGMDGFTVCSRLKSDIRLKHIPVVMVTAAATDRQMRIKALEVGADAFLNKPVDVSELVAQIRAMLRIKSAEDLKKTEKERLETLVKERTEALIAELGERKKVEESLQKSEEKYKYIFTNSPQPMMIFDIETLQFLEVNQTAVDFYGYSRSEFAAMTIADIRPAEDILLLMKSVDNARKGNDEDIQVRHITKRGQLKFVNVSAHSLMYEGRRARQVIINDLTDRHEAEQKLQKSEQQLLAAMGIAKLCSWEFDINSSSFLLNDHFYALVGCSFSDFGTYEMSTREYEENFLFPEDYGLVDRIIDQTKHSENPLRTGNLEHRVRLGGGKSEGVVFVEFHTLNGENGEVVKAYGILQNITEKKKAENALAESEAKFRTLASNSPMAIMIYQDDYWVYTNIAGEQMCGYSQEELLKMHFWGFVSPEFEDKVKKIGRLRQSGENINTSYEIKIITKTGEEKWVFLTGNTIIFNGKSAGFISVADITAQKMVQEELLKRDAILQAAASAGQLLLSDAPLDEAVETVLKCIVEATGKDYIYIYELHDDAVSQRHLISQYCSWNALEQKVLFRIPENQNLDLRLAAPQSGRFMLEGKIIRTDVENLPEPERSSFLRRGVVSLLALPMMIEGRCEGFVGIESMRDKDNWSEVECSILQTTASSIGMAIVRHRRNKELEQAKHKLEESEMRVRRKLEAVLDPEGGVQNLELSDILDKEAVQKLMDSFYAITGLGIGIIDNKGEVFVAEGWQDICMNYHRVHPETCKNCHESDCYLSDGIAAGQHKLYKCKNNMWDIATPIVVGDHKLGNIFLGQFLFEGEEIDFELFRSQANRYGFNEDDYIEALKNVPRFSKSKTEWVMDFYARFGQMIASLGYGNVKLARVLAEKETLFNKLSENESLLRSFIDNAPFELWARNEEGIAVIENQKLRENNGSIVGSTLEDIAGKEAELLKWKSMNERVFAGETISEEYEYEANGRTRIVQQIVFPIHKQESIAGIAGFNIDITERKEAERTLEESQKSYVGLFNTIDEAVYIHKLNEGFIAVNNGALKMYGCDRDYIIGKTPADLAAPGMNDLEHVGQLMHLVMETGISQQFEFWGVRLNGEIFPKEVSSNRGIYFGEEVIITTARDISERKKQDIALRESEEKFRLLAINSTDVIWTMDLTGQILYVSPSVEKLRGYTPAETVEHGIDGTIAPHSAAIAKKVMMEAIIQIKNGVRPASQVLEMEQLCKDGSTVWTEMSISAVFDEENQFHYFLGVSRNIEARRNAELALIQSEHSLRENNELLNSILESPKNIIIFSLDKNYCYKSFTVSHKETMKWIWGVEIEVGMNMLDVISLPEDKEKAKSNFDRALNGDYLLFTEEYGDKSLNRSYWENRYSPIFSEKGEITGLTVFVTNVTEQRSVADALRVSEEKYRLIAENMVDVIWTYDLTNREMTYTSPSVLRQRGFTVEEAMRIPYREMLTPESAIHAKKEFMEWIDAFKSGDKSVIAKSISMDMYHKDGRIIHTESLMSPLFDSDGNLSGLLGVTRDTTKRKELADALRKSENYMRTLINAMSDFVCFKDGNGRWMVANDYLVSLVQLEGVDYTDKNNLDLAGLSSAEYEVFYNCEITDQKAWNLKTQIQSDELIKTKDGELRVFDVVKIPLFDEAGNRFGLVEVGRDITDRKRAEDELKLFREHLQHLVDVRTAELRKFSLVVEQGPVAVAITNVKGEIEYVNPRFVERAGYLPKEVIGKNPRILKSGVHDDAFYKSMWMRISKGEVWTGEICNRNKKGELYWESTAINSIKDSNGKIIHYIAVKEDITKRKQMETDLLRASLLADSALELTKAGYWHVPNDGSGTINTSARAAQIYGDLISDELKHNLYKDRFVNMLDGDSNTPDTVLSNFNDALAGKIPMYDSIYKYVRPVDGKIVWLHALGQVVKNLDGKITDMYGVTQDITLFKELEEDLLNAKIEAEKANKAKSEFLANMSHEIRTPMNAVIGFSDLLFTSVKETKQRAQINSIRSSARNLMRIINDILDLSKIEAGKLTLQYSKVNLMKMVKELELLFSHSTEEKGLEFGIRTITNVPPVLILDEVRLRQILFNLVGNAVKFTNEGSVKIAISHEFTQADKLKICIDVQDTGIGIPEDQQKTIFEAFSQQAGQRVAQYGGTGLGLTITQRLVEMMGGTISVKSTPAKGSTFTVVLPQVEYCNCKDGVTESEEMPDIRAIRFEQARVLVIDKDKENRKLIVDLLEQANLLVSQSAKGKDALALLTENRFDLIIIDPLLGDMSGVELLKKIRANSNYATIPVIACSASNKSITVDGKEEYFNEALLKPVDLSVLMDRLKRYLLFSVVDFEDNSQATVEENNKLPDISPLLMSQLPELIAVLEQSFFPVFERVLKNQMIDEIYSFGEELFMLSERYNFAHLREYANSVCSFADSFEIEALMKKLSSFPDLIDFYKELTHSRG